MSEKGFRSHAASNYGDPAVDSPAPSGHPSVDEIIIGQDVPLFYSVDYETKMLSDAGILEGVEEVFDASSLGDSDVLPLDDWSLPGDFSFDSALLGSAEHAAASPPQALTIRPLSPPPVATSHTYRSPSSSTVPPVKDKPLVAQPRYFVQQREQEEPSGGGPIKRRGRPVKQREQEEPSGGGPIKRRGRPVKVGSTSKSALYAREYRTKSKELLENYRLQVEQLMQRNRALETNHSRLTQKYSRLQEEFEEVQEVNQKLQAQILPAVSKIIGAESASLKDVCIHLSDRGDVTVKSCRHCKSPQSQCRPSKVPLNSTFEEYLC
uniref:BZIP domain-containing protein n=1 Tax=Steinernema glaseri TaxID=37863 RepID=A0A1I8APZ6_9BILA